MKSKKSFTQDPKKNNRVLIISNSLSGGGAEESAFCLFETLQEHSGFEVFLCTVNRGADRSIRETLKDNYIPMAREHRAGMLETFKTIIQFQRILKTYQPGILIANCELPELLVAMTKQSKAITICVEHTTKPWENRRILGSLVRFILWRRNCNWVTVNSSQRKIWWAKQYPHFIPNPVNAFHQNPASVSRDLRLAYIGRLIPSKRPNWVIEAGAKLNLPVDIYGIGELEAQLKQGSVARNLAVDFHGFVENPSQYLGRNTLLVVPSEHEGDGLVVSEGILANSPILLSDNRDLRRFDLPEVHYFKTLEGLIENIKISLRDEFSSLLVPMSIREKLATERSPLLVAKLWENLMIDINSKEPIGREDGNVR